MKPELLPDGIRVLELGHIVSGPTAGLILADLGADVVKVERPDGGDISRSRPDQSMFLTFNRNKRSLVLDLKSAKGKEIFLRLLEKADIVVDNYAPGVMGKMGLGYDVLSARNPRIIHCSIKGFLPGPYGSRPLLDEPAQMMGGLAYMTGPVGQPMRAGTSVIDISTGMFGIIGILAALHKRRETGRGQQVETGLFETTAFMISQYVATASLSGECPPPISERLKGKGVGWAIYRIFQTGDKRQIFIGITSDAHWERFCREFAVQDLWEDLSLRTNMGRVAKVGPVNERVQQIVEQIPLDSAVERLEKNQIPYAVINTPMDLLQDPHLRGRGQLIEVHSPNGRSAELPGLPLIFDSRQAGVRKQPPKMGEHSEEIMRELGYASERIEELLQEGVIRSGSRPAAS